MLEMLQCVTVNQVGVALLCLCGHAIAIITVEQHHRIHITVSSATCSTSQ